MSFESLRSYSDHILRRLTGRSFKLDAVPDVPEGDRRTIKTVERFTMASPERLHAVCEAVRYVENSSISGDIVECGVWRGGSMMAAALTLLSLGSTERQFFLFDTFEGMSPPDQHDISLDGERASDLGELHEKNESDRFWCYAPLDAVKKAVFSTGYPSEKFHFLKGRVEETLPISAPEKIAILRLDTDWYESTRHELETLYPRLVRGGVLILDDYGHWQGARKAVDEYIGKHNLKLFLSRTDYTGRVAVKAFE